MLYVSMSWIGIDESIMNLRRARQNGLRGDWFHIRLPLHAGVALLRVPGFFGMKPHNRSPSIILHCASEEIGPDVAERPKQWRELDAIRYGTLSHWLMVCVDGTLRLRDWDGLVPKPGKINQRLCLA